MRRRFYLFVIMVLLACFASLSVSDGEKNVAADEGECRILKSRQWKKLVKLLPAYLWETDETKVKKVKKEWEKNDYSHVQMTKKQCKEAALILRNGNPYTTERRKELQLKIVTGVTLEDGTDEKMPVKMSAPPKYRKACGRPFGLVITMHGGPMPTVNSGLGPSNTQYGLWNSVGGSIDCIVAAPVITGSKWGVREWTLLSNIIKEADAAYNLDYDRIMLTGHSWGGILTWQMGTAFANRFAVLAPFVCAVNPGRNGLGNCRNLPIYSVQGKFDAPFIVRDGKARIEILKSLGYEYVFVEGKGGHESFAGEITKIAKWFKARPRNMYSVELVRNPAGANDSDYWYWIKSGQHRFTARIEKGNRIEVSFFSSFEVYLSDEMVDLDKKVTITRDGEVVWEGKVIRQLSFMLNHWKESGDRGRLFSASVVIE